MFAHIYFLYHPGINQGGIFRYKYWSVFFDSMMWPTFAFVVGYLVQLLKNNYITDRKGIRYANLVSVKAYCISIYYFSITAFPYHSSFKRIGLDHEWYYIIAVICAILAALLIIRLPKSLKQQVKDLRLKVDRAKTLVSGFIDLYLKWEYRADDPNEFRKDWYNKSREGGLF